MTQWAAANLQAAASSSQILGASATRRPGRLARTPPILRETLAFPYTTGFNFVQAATATGGWPAVDAFYERDARVDRADPPSREVHRRARRRSTVTMPADLATRLGPGWTRPAPGHVRRAPARDLAAATAASIRPRPRRPPPAGAAIGWPCWRARTAPGPSRCRPPGTPTRTRPSSRPPRRRRSARPGAWRRCCPAPAARRAGCSSPMTRRRSEGRRRAGPGRLDADPGRGRFPPTPHRRAWISRYATSGTSATAGRGFADSSTQAEPSADPRMVSVGRNDLTIHFLGDGVSQGCALWATGLCALGPQW